MVVDRYLVSKTEIHTGRTPKCLLPSNNQEAAGGPVGCGLGPELALILSLLGLAQARYRSPRPSHEDSGRTK